MFFVKRENISLYIFKTSNWNVFLVGAVFLNGILMYLFSFPHNTKILSRKLFNYS